jgi:DNA transformation protein
MTAASPKLVAELLARLSPLGAVAPRRYFGGVGLVLDEVQFAFVMGRSIYFAVDDRTRPAYQARRSRPFLYETRNGIRVVEAFYRLPKTVLGDSEALVEWGDRAVAAARAKRSRR